MKFKYFKLQVRPQHDPLRLKFVELPLVDIYFALGEGRKLRYFCLVDSGSEYCIFSDEVAKNLGLELKKGKEMQARGVTGQTFKAYFLPVTFKIGGWSCETEVGFSKELGTPYGILGRRGFFEKFRVCFDEEKAEVELIPKKST